VAKEAAIRLYSVSHYHYGLPVRRQTGLRSMRRRVFVLLLVIFVSGILGVLACVATRPFNGISAEALRADLEKRLPEGSSWDEGLDWFASHGIRADAIVDDEGRTIGLAAIIANDSLTEAAEIRIELYFSRDQQLRRRVVYRFVYGL
jgi:hypothetical protein